MASTVPSNAVQIIKDIGAGALPDNPSKTGLNARQIKNAIERPSVVLAEWLKAIESKSDANEEELNSKFEQFKQEFTQSLALYNNDLTLEFVDVLPETGRSGIIYMVPNPNSGELNMYDEYVWLDSWELMTPEVDYSDYVTNAQMVTYLDGRGLDSVEIIGVPNWE